MPTEPAIAEPRYRLAQLATFELSDYRRQLETAIASFSRQDPVPPARDHLQAKLDDVLAEQESRKWPAHGR